MQLFQSVINDFCDYIVALAILYLFYKYGSQALNDQDLRSTEIEYFICDNVLDLDDDDKK